MASRSELIQWVNDLLLLSYTKVEQCGTGAAYAQIVDSVYGNVAMMKLNFAAKHDYEYVNNYKVLQDTFKRNKIDKPIPVEKLVKCKMQDNLEFLQWMKKFWDQNYPGTEYDPEGRRQGQGVAPPPLHGISTARAVVGAPLSSTANRSPVRKAPSGTTAAPVRRAAVPAVGSTARVARSAAVQVVPDETIQALTNQMDEMKVSVDSLERERDFYFNKLRDIELMIQDRIALIEHPMEGDEKIPEGGPEEVLLKQIQAVLYSTEDGFEVPEGQEPPLDEEEVF
ncbi:hypothetical protein CBS101457_004225 [Exobasidium rhododendri]|nr:hypothetical protein CBS101457_004225 [Exobasidium rhododendri]